MATVASLHLYPVKSCRGLDVDEALLGPKGLEALGVGDRQWAIIDTVGNALTQREYPRLALIAPRASEGSLTLSAPGAGDFVVTTDTALRCNAAKVILWGKAVNGWDEGEWAARWISDFLGTPARLVRFDERERHASSSAVTGEIEALNRFSDGYPILLLSRASLTDLNARWMTKGHARLPMDRFRPNVVIDGVEAYDEDHLAALVHAEFELRPVKGSPRCSIPSVDQATGQVGPAPLEMLVRYRFDARVGGAAFGQNVVVIRGYGARLHVGQTVATRWNF